jgi:hypothetical protein
MIPKEMKYSNHLNNKYYVFLPPFNEPDYIIPKAIFGIKDKQWGTWEEVHPTMYYKFALSGL